MCRRGQYLRNGLAQLPRELDLFLSWTVNEMLTVSPLLGFYKPDESLQNGGVQLDNDDMNVYGQLVVLINF